MAITTEATAKWGVGDRSIPVEGVITEVSSSVEMLATQETDEDGAVCGQFLYDRKYSVSVTVQAPAGAEPPAPGDPIDVDGYPYYVVSAQEMEANQAYRKISVTAEAYENCSDVETQNAGGEE